MGVMMRQLVGSAFDALRYEPTAKRLRISLAGEPVADTRNGLLVWQPRRVGARVCRSGARFFRRAAAHST